jgi:hypothetical protein
MRSISWRLRSALILAAAGLAIGATLVLDAAPAVANNATNCASGYFCFYSSTGFGGSRGTQFAYTSGWVRMSSLVDDSESSWDAQTADGAHCVNDLNPFVYLSDTYLSTRWLSFVGGSAGANNWTFGSMPTSQGQLNMNNRYNDIWNLCT